MCSLPFLSKTLCLVTSPPDKANWSTTATDCSQMFSQGSGWTGPSGLTWRHERQPWGLPPHLPRVQVGQTLYEIMCWLLESIKIGYAAPEDFPHPPLPRTATPGMRGRLSGKRALAASLQAVKCPSFLTPQCCSRVIVPSSSSPADKMDPLQALMHTVRHRGDIHRQFLSLDEDRQKSLPGHYILVLNSAYCFCSRPRLFLVTGQISTKTSVHESLRQQRRTKGSNHCQTRLRLGISKYIHLLSPIGSFLNEHEPKIYLSQKSRCWTSILYWQKWSSCWF